MKTVVITRDVDDDELAALLTPRTDPAEEVELAPGVFSVDDGPFDLYERRVDVGAPTAAGPTADPAPVGRHAVTETTRFQLALPAWGFLFTPLVVRAIRKPPAPGTHLWWLPPDRLNRRMTTVLGIVCVYSLFAGYLGVLLSQTNTFFKADFGA